MKVEELLQIEDLTGKVIAFPTDTVYGVGCLINDESSIKRIYDLKERDFDKPLAILVGSIEDAISLVENLPSQAVELIKNHWPGALTIICKKSNSVPLCLNPRFQTIGIRMPNNKVALDILKKHGPMAVTSINKSGETPLNEYGEIVINYQDKINYIVEGNEKSSNVSSTVIEIIDNEIKILRQGNIII